MPVSAPERQYLLNQLNRLAKADLDRLWAAAERLPTGRFFQYVLDGFPNIVDPYNQTAAQLAATWFEESDPESTYVATLAAPIREERLTTSARWALGASGRDALSRLEGTLQRAVYDGARDTTLVNVRRSRSKWARYASANACEFCQLLATRADAYRSESTAATEVHDHCSCLPVEVRDGDYTPPDYVQRWEENYQRARDNADSGSTTAILAAWRQLGDT